VCVCDGGSAAVTAESALVVGRLQQMFVATFGAPDLTVGDLQLRDDGHFARAVHTWRTPARELSGAKA
jgi:hypothetical protein